MDREQEARLKEYAKKELRRWLDAKGIHADIAMSCKSYYLESYGYFIDYVIVSSRPTSKRNFPKDKKAENKVYIELDFCWAAARQVGTELGRYKVKSSIAQTDSSFMRPFADELKDKVQEINKIIVDGWRQQ